MKTNTDHACATYLVYHIRLDVHPLTPPLLVTLSCMCIAGHHDHGMGALILVQNELLMLVDDYSTTFSTNNMVFYKIISKHKHLQCCPKHH